VESGGRKSILRSKDFLAKLPTLTTPIPKERLKMFLSASNQAISAYLMVERNEKQTPIYYISRVLTPLEINYSMLGKLVLALVHTSRRQKRYFQVHIVKVLTNFTLQHVLRRPELSGRLTKWAVELGAFNIEFKARPTIKGQVIAYFLVEMPASAEINIPAQ
jgi:hypothetical protein